jgi:hypothetical protein
MDEGNDESPLPPETIAVSFEVDADKPELIGNYNGAPGREEDLPHGETEIDEAPPPPEIMAVAFEKQLDEEEKREECDDDEAPRPPELIASSYEVTDSVHREVKTNIPESIDDTIHKVPEGRITSIHESEESISIMQHIGHLDESNNDATPATINDREVLSYLSLLSDQRRNTNVEDVTLLITSTSHGGNDASLPASSQGHVETPSLTQELMSPPRLYVDPYNQSLPLLEATLVQDVPDEPVYEAFPLSETQNNGEPGWLRFWW